MLSQFHAAVVVGTCLLSHSILAVSQPTSASPPAVIPQAPEKYTGVVVAASATHVSLKDKDGNIVSVVMTPGWTVVSTRAVDLGAIKLGDFIATANVNTDANSGRSTELRILEPGYRPEVGTHPLAQPNTSMTHGDVTKITRGDGALEIDVSYPGGSRHLTVAAGTKITGYNLHDRSLVDNGGVAVTAVTRKGADGISRAGRLVLADP